MQISSWIPDREKQVFDGICEKQNPLNLIHDRRFGRCF